MKRLMEKIVFCGFVTCWRLAGAPTSRWPSFAKATTDGVVRPPSRFGITVGSPPSSTAIHELVVPRSMPIVLAMLLKTSKCREKGKKRRLGAASRTYVSNKSKRDIGRFDFRSQLLGGRR